jgi:flagellar motor switch protein FliG
MALSGREKATIFLSILGAENSSRILRYLPDELADIIASGINHLPSPSPEAMAEVLNEFNSFLALPEADRAVAPAVAEAPVEESASALPVRYKKSYGTLVYERPQVAAFLISLMPEEQREEALQCLPREKGIIQEILAGLKSNSLTPVLMDRMKEQFAGKLF